MSRKRISQHGQIKRMAATDNYWERWKVGERKREMRRGRGKEREERKREAETCLVSQQLSALINYHHGENY